MSELKAPTGLFFEDYLIDGSIVSQGRTITETDIVNFAAFSGDWNPLHIDAEVAGESQFGERIAHGLLVLSIASGLSERLGFLGGNVLFFKELIWQFRAAVMMGDTIRVKATVSELRPVPRLGGGYVTFKVQVLNQADKVVQRGSWILLIKSKEE
ncbi:MAG: MaoC/PaaZ C-terminal domain-containing protein [Chloroflexota bacterium]|nr:MaoC/PaaZ C-terminal domain-containing protein [Chloroflexota bacterium]